MIDSSVTIAGLRFRNPVIAASGTFGFGFEYEGLVDSAGLGGICTKALTLTPRAGNTGTRLYETPSGLMNSIGLENPGISAFVKTYLPRLRELGPVIIANLAGNSLEEYVQGAALLSACSVDAVELNISCPNVKEGQSFGLSPELAAGLTRAVRKVCAKPLIVKLSPNATDIAAVARACAEAGADALSLVNTFTALAIDIHKGRPVFDSIFAGLSGPAIRPLALKALWQLWEAVDLPIIGIGGIRTADDALEFLMSGAAAVEVGSATFAHPPAMTEIISGIESYMAEKGIVKTSGLSIRKRSNRSNQSIESSSQLPYEGDRPCATPTA
jgi:dihydroorotate dehydrogenase (NAD+) catalytic subunit